jgi:mono/diheme cytochrome c family protein
MKSQLLKSKDPFKRLISVLMGLGIFIIAISCTNSATEKETDEGEDVAETVALTPVEEGREWYLSYCTMCHGEDGKGKGVLADSLRQPPLDLTTITLRRGEFSSELMAKIIAGVEEVPGHSTGDMPAWFETFKESENITSEVVLNEKIDHIVAYLKSIQLTEWPEDE